MCGISGGVGKSAPTKPELLEILERIKHRGPDSSGVYSNSHVTLGNCRLEIVEIKDGAQPFTSIDNNVTVVFNGEIYNYNILRQQLSNYGFKFTGNSEAEVITSAYLHYGLDFIKKLSGMFAIAVYDHRSNSLILARDRLGEKPLWYYQKDDGTLIFGSEIKSFLPLVTDKSINEGSIYELMKYGYINPPNSIYSKIYALTPASILVYKENNISISKYWEINFQEKLKISYPEALQQTYNLIDKTVNSMLTSERPTGIFLSGGYDSTLVAGFLTKNSETKIDSFSIGFENRSYDESDSARQVAKYLGTNHHERILKPDPKVFFTEIITKLDQPFADSSYIPTYELARFASSSVVVAFGGDGGDEICAGYDRYLAATRFHRINSILPILKLPISMLSKFTKLSKQKQFKLENQLRSFPDMTSRYDSLVSLNLEKDLSSIFSSDSFINNYKIAHLTGNSLTSKADKLSKLLEIDFDNYLPGDLLVKADLATMSHGLELRSPLLNYELVEWMAKLPSDYKIHGFTTKRLLKDITHKFVPKNIMNRPKMGFAIPRADWLRNELRDLSHDLLTDKSAKSRQFFDAKEINKVLSDHKNGIDRDQIIWPALCLEVWARNWL